MKIKFFISIISLSLSLNNCSYINIPENIIVISGSDTMLELNENLAKEFMKNHPDISIYVKGGGTRVGINDLINNRCDIAAASRNLLPEESMLLAKYYGSLALVYLIAKDGLSLYVNPHNIVNDLSLIQVKDIFTGRVRNWKDVGGEDKEIILVSRNPNSGTYQFFKEHILEGENYSDKLITFNSTKDMIKFIRNNDNAIGFGGMGFNDGVVQIRIEGVYPSEQNIRNDTYPITRYLHFLLRKSPSGNVKKFLDWVLSAAGQNIIRNSGFISLWEYRL